MTTVRLAPDGSVLDRAEGRLPRRFRLPPSAVRRLAALAGTTLPWPELEVPASDDGALTAAGLLDPLGDVLPEARIALARLEAAEVLVDVDVSVRRAGAPAGHARLHSWQRPARGGVTALSTALGDVAELAWFDLDAWHSELSRCAAVTMPAHAAEPPAAGLDLPYDLLLGSGAALRDHRLDVFDELLARDADEVLVGEERLGRAAASDQLRRLHRNPVGRLQAVVTGGSRLDARRCGWMSWLVFADGWRELTPYSSAGRARVRLDPRRPLDLGVRVATLVTKVRS